MKVLMKISCLSTAQLLLWFFAFGFLGCSSLKNVDNEALKETVPLFQVTVRGNDLVFFNQQIQELGLVVFDFRTAKMNLQNADDNGFWITFRFVNRRELLAGSSAIMATGVAYRTNYKQ